MEARKTVWTPGGQIRGWERSVEARRAAWRQARLSEERPRKAQSRRKGPTISFLKDTGQGKDVCPD